MATHKPDAPTLDALVLGTDDADDLDAWKWLLEAPDAPQAWSEAMERRRRVDATARLVQARPWLARAWLAIRRLGGASAGASGLEAQVASSLAGAMLSAPTSSPVTPAWGTTERLLVAVGERTHIVAPPNCQRWYSVAGRSGALPEDAWVLEAGEAPVLIVVTEGPAEATLEAALATARRAASVVIDEAVAKGENEG